MSPRYERRQRGGGGALLLLIAAAALVVAVLAIFTDVFSGKKAPDKDTDSPAVTQPADGEPDGTGDADNTAKDPEGDQKGGQSGNGDGNTDKSTVTTTKPAASNVITTDATPYQSGGVYIVGNAGYEMYNYVGSLAEKYQSTVNAVADSLSGVSNVYAMAIPLSSSITLPDSLLSDIPGSDQAQAEKDILAGMGQNIKTVPLHDALNAHRTEYIYFRTDHHWTALGAWYAYAEWAKMAGFEPVPLSEYEEIVQEPFYGSLYYQAHQSGKLTADQVYGYVPPGDVHLYINQGSNDSLSNRGYEQTLITQIHGNDKYMCFLTGDFPLCTFINNDITDGSACLLVKNSNGNPFGYYLTQHYQYVYVMDYRKYFSRPLTKFVDYYDVDDVIFCLSSGQAQSAGGNSLLQGLIQ